MQGILHGRAARDEPHVVQSQIVPLEPSALSTALTALWHQRLLCDIILRAPATPQQNTPTPPPPCAAPPSAPPPPLSPTPPPLSPPPALCEPELQAVGSEVQPPAPALPGAPAAAVTPADVSAPHPKWSPAAAVRAAPPSGPPVGNTSPSAALAPHRTSTAPPPQQPLIIESDPDGGEVRRAGAEDHPPEGLQAAEAAAAESESGTYAHPSNQHHHQQQQQHQQQHQEVAVEDLPAHRVVLAAGCEYFRALLTGAGALMADLVVQPPQPSQRSAQPLRVTTTARPQTDGEDTVVASQVTGVGGGGGGSNGLETAGCRNSGVDALPVVWLPGLDSWSLRLAVGALYERQVEVTADNLEALVAAASYLGAGSLLDACAAFMRSNLGLHTCLPLLLLAWRYNLGPLKEELLAYVCRRFSVLVRLHVHPPPPPTHTSPPPADSSQSATFLSLATPLLGGGEVSLSEMPGELLLEVLGSEELGAECESDVLQACVDWLAAGDHPHNHQYDVYGDRTALVQQLAATVHWAALPVPPHLQLSHGSAAAAQACALRRLLSAAAAAAQHDAEATSSPNPGGPMYGSSNSNTSGRYPPAVSYLQKLLSDIAPSEYMQLVSQDMSKPLAAPPLASSLTSSFAAFRSPPAVAPQLCGGVGGPSGEPMGRIGPVVLDTHSSGGAAAPMAAGGGSWRQRRRLASCLVAVGGHDGSWRPVKGVEVYDPRRDVWTAAPALLQGLSFAGSALVPGGSGGGSGGGAVYVVGGTPLCSSVWRLAWGPVGPTGRSWEACAALGVPRAHAGVAAVAGLLTVSGGRSQVQQVQHVLNTVEILMPSPSSPASFSTPATTSASTASVSPLQDTAAAAAAGVSGGGPGVWQRGPDMVLPRSAHACAVLGGGLYALGGAGSGGAGGSRGGGGGGGAGGGSAGGGGSTHRSGEVLDFGSGRWVLLGAEMRSERKYLAAAAHGGRIYVCGGVNECRSRLSCLEALDPREGRWAVLQPMSAPRSSHAMAALGGCLYVVGGQCSNAEAATITAATSPTPLGGSWPQGGMLAGGLLGVSPPSSQPHILSQWQGAVANLNRMGLITSSPPPPGLYGSPPSLAMASYGGGGGSTHSARMCTGPGPGMGLGLGLGGYSSSLSVYGDEVAVHQVVECYDTAAGRWRLCAPLHGGGRAGLALCAA